MKHRKIIKLLNEYFKEKRLKVLDNNTKRYYTGVTIPYIMEYICKNCEVNDVVDILILLHKKKKIRALYCADVKDIVFESKKANLHWNYNLDDINISGKKMTYKTNKYSFFLENVNYYKKL